MPDEQIADLYDWEKLHHIHSVARSIYSGCNIEHETIGSIHIFEMKPDSREESFDFADLYPTQAVLVKLGDIEIVSVLNDSCGAGNGFMNYSKRITGLVSGLQLREILAHLGAVNARIKHRPIFFTQTDPLSGQSSICASVPEKFEMNAFDSKYFGKIMEFTCGDVVRQMENADKEQIIKLIIKGKYTFLFNEDGTFDTNSIIENQEI